jgi:hypothetical protein
LATVFRETYLPQKLVRIDLADILESAVQDIYATWETTRDQDGTGSSFIDFDREQGSNAFVAQRHLTKGAVLFAIGDTDVPGDVRNTATDLCTTSPLGPEAASQSLAVLSELAVRIRVSS